jgi:hypothetical protein
MADDLDNERIYSTEPNIAGREDALREFNDIFRLLHEEGYKLEFDGDGTRVIRVTYKSRSVETDIGLNTTPESLRGEIHKLFSEEEEGEGQEDGTADQQVESDTRLGDNRDIRPDDSNPDYTGNERIPFERKPDKRYLVLAPSGSGKSYFIQQNPDQGLVDMDHLITWPEDKAWHNDTRLFDAQMKHISETISTWLEGSGGEIGFYSSEVQGTLIPDAVVIIDDDRYLQNLQSRPRDKTYREDSFDLLKDQQQNLIKKWGSRVIHDFNVLLQDNFIIGSQSEDDFDTFAKVTSNL